MFIRKRELWQKFSSISSKDPKNLLKTLEVKQIRGGRKESYFYLYTYKHVQVEKFSNLLKKKGKENTNSSSRGL